MKIIAFILFASVCIAFTSCEKFLDKQPISELSTDNFWNNADDAKAGMAGIYSTVQSTFSSNYLQWGETRSDNFTHTRSTDGALSITLNALNSLTGSANWVHLYRTISRANFAIKYLPRITMDQNLKNHYLAQAYGIRAQMYFYAVRVWGDVPVWLEPYEDKGTSADRPRTPVSEIYNTVIIPDLIKAYELSDPGNFNVYELNRGGILAMQMDVYMFLKDYPKALEASDKLMQLNRYALASTTDWKKIFTDPMATKENIWSLNWNYLQDGTNGIGGLIGSSDANSQFAIESDLKRLFQANPNDIRTVLTYDSTLVGNERRIGKFYEMSAANKPVYPLASQNSTKNPIYRYADILLMRAEALNMTSITNKATAIGLVNQIRQRANATLLNPDDYATQREVETAILNERRLELFAEGKRWFDLVRTNRVLETMDPIVKERQEARGISATGFSDPDRILFPIHRNALNNNKLLVQNPGYSE